MLLSKVVNDSNEQLTSQIQEEFPGQGGVWQAIEAAAERAGPQMIQQEA